jgi:putative membrane protein
MRHTSRGLLLWLALLPSGLLGAGCTTLPKLLLVVLTTAYIMLGIDEIGIQIEQPFDILPLHALATVLTRDVEDQLCKW